MADTEQTKSTSTERCGDSKFNFSCGNFKEMFKMMQKFCAGKEGTFDCGAMMQKMCCGAPEKSGQQ